MALYDYKCKKCNKKFEKDRPMSDNSGDDVKCPFCGNVGCEKQITRPLLRGGKNGQSCEGSCSSCNGCSF